MSETVSFSSAPEVFARAQRLFDEVALRIAAMLPHAELHQVGSTALPGSLTKGDLDVLVRVAADGFDDADRALGEVFERNTGSVRTDQFSAFKDDSTDPPLGVQLVVAGSEFDVFLEWLELLRRAPDLRREYDELKRRFDGKPMNAYRQAKERFIGQHIRG